MTLATIVIALAAVATVFVAFYQSSALKDANARTDQIIHLTQTAVAISERSWRDSRRAFLEFEKPDFTGPTVSHVNGPYIEPTQWTLNVTNTGAISSPEYVVEQSCVGAFPIEQTEVPCKHEPSDHRPLVRGGSDPIYPLWKVGDGPTAQTFDRVALGEEDVYVYVVIRYYDGLGRRLEQPSCWTYTKKEDSGTVMRGDEHYVKRCHLLNTPEHEIR